MFYKIRTANKAVDGKIAEEKERKVLKDVEYIQVMFNSHGMREYAWYPSVQLEPIAPPIAWFGELVKVENE